VDLTDLAATLRTFAEARGWEKFHTPKNLAVSVSIEAAELLELVQWRTDDEAIAYFQANEGGAALRDELADVPIYVVRLADVAGIDLQKAVDAKIEQNRQRFPASAEVRDHRVLRGETNRP
jgi:NTP pyrophosphatase (non-canonical NTP hydrolase)